VHFSFYILNLGDGITLAHILSAVAELKKMTDEIISLGREFYSIGTSLHSDLLRLAQTSMAFMNNCSTLFDVVTPASWLHSG
jgi:hypothetical protein